MTSRTQFDLLDANADRNRPIVATDLEGTLYTAQLYKGLLNYIEQEEGRTGFTRSFMLKRLHYLPIVKLELRAAQQVKINTMIDLMAQWRGVSRAEFQKVVESIVDNVLFPNLRQSVLTELNGHLADGKRVMIVSGMPEPFLKGLLAKLEGFEAIGTPMRFEGDTFMGEHIGEYNVQMHKVDSLRQVLGEEKLSAAYGDTGSDIAMLSLAHDPVAVAPDKKLLSAAQANNWRIISS